METFTCLVSIAFVLLFFYVLDRAHKERVSATIRDFNDLVHDIHVIKRTLDKFEYEPLRKTLECKIKRQEEILEYLKKHYKAAYVQAVKYDQSFSEGNNISQKNEDIRLTKDTETLSHDYHASLRDNLTSNVKEVRDMLASGSLKWK